MERKKSPADIKGAILLISGLNSDINEYLDSFELYLLSEEERFDKLTMLMETSAHYESVLLTLMWLYGKITNEELLFGKLPKRLV